MTKRRGLIGLILATFLAGGCVSEVDKYFSQKRLNRLGIPRDDIGPGTLVIHKDGTAQSTVTIGEVAPEAELTVSPFSAVLPSATRNRSIDASVALKVVESVIPIGFDGSMKLSNNVKIGQTTASGLKIGEEQLRVLLTKPEGVPLKDWVLARAQRNIKTFVVMQTYRAKQFTMTAESGKDITNELSVGELKPIQKGSVTFSVKRTSKEQLEITGDKEYVVAVSVAAFDVQGQGSRVRLGSLGVDLSRPIPNVPVLSGRGAQPITDLYRPIGLQRASER